MNQPQITNFNFDSHRRPNIIWIFGDQHRAQSTGYRGDPNVSTPNKERCYELLSQWITTTGDNFSLPDIKLNERGTPAEQYFSMINHSTST